MKSSQTNAFGFVRNGIVNIRSDVDRRYRKALYEAVSQDGNAQARWLIRNALDNGPSRGGAAESIRYFGDGLDANLKLTGMIVDGIEISVPGFKKWLELTGFGNDKTMIRGFVAWAEHKHGWGKVMTGVREAFDA